MSIYDFSVNGIDGHPIALSSYHGRVLLIVNIASKCGFAGQYTSLEELQKKYCERGFDVLGFPCNQFLWQEPGDGTSCRVSHGVSFPLFAKIKVNGSQTDPLYEYLKNTCRGTLGTKWIKWNFTKFLINREGVPVQRFGTATPPQHLEAAIESHLK